MSCPRCGSRDAINTSSWCTDCEKLYDAWSRQHATDILWQTGSGAGVAMVLVLGGLALGASPLLGIVGFLGGFTTFVGLRVWGNRRRRQQYLTATVPRAYLPGGS